MKQVRKCPVCERHPLGFPRRARREKHVRQVVRSGLGRKELPACGRPFEFEKFALRIRHGRPPPFEYDKVRACDAYHPGQAFAGQRRVERQAGRPRLQCGKKGDDQPLRTFHENPDDIAAACARLPQAGRQTGRLPVQFAAGEGHRSVPQGGGAKV